MNLTEFLPALPASVTVPSVSAQDGFLRLLALRATHFPDTLRPLPGWLKVSATVAASLSLDRRLVLGRLAGSAPLRRRLAEARHARARRRRGGMMSGGRVVAGGIGTVTGKLVAELSPYADSAVTVQVSDCRRRRRRRRRSSRSRSESSRAATGRCRRASRRRSRSRCTGQCLTGRRRPGDRGRDRVGRRLDLDGADVARAGTRWPRLAALVNREPSRGRGIDAGAARPDRRARARRQHRLGRTAIEAERSELRIGMKVATRGESALARSRRTRGCSRARTGRRSTR